MMKWVKKIVVPRIAPKWEDVAYELLIPYSNIEKLKSDSKGDVKGCCFDMLKAWVHAH